MAEGLTATFDCRASGPAAAAAAAALQARDAIFHSRIVHGLIVHNPAILFPARHEDNVG